MTIEQAERIQMLAAEMRKQASAKGPQHGFWDYVFDMEAFGAGRPAGIKKSVNEWIQLGEELLQLQPGQVPR